MENNHSDLISETTQKDHWFFLRLRSIYIIWYREILIYFRNYLKFFTSIFLPLLLLVFFGTGIEAVFPAELLEYDFIQFFFPGIIGASISVMALSSTISIVWDREFGFLREILVSPIKRADIALGKILGATSTAVFQGFFIVLFAPYLKINFSTGLFLKTMGIIFMVAYGMSALGILFVSRLKKMESFSILSQIIVAPMVFLSGAFFPIGNLPSWMAALSRYNPLTFGIDALRWITLSKTMPASKISSFSSYPFSHCLIFLIIFDMIITIISVQMFRRIK